MKEISDKDNILDELFEIRTDEFAKAHLKKIGKEYEIYDISDLIGEIEDSITSFVNDKKISDIILKKINKLDDYIEEELQYWCKQYYKKGVSDGMNLLKETKEINITK